MMRIFTLIGAGLFAFGQIVNPPTGSGGAPTTNPTGGANNYAAISGQTFTGPVVAPGLYANSDGAAIPGTAHVGTYSNTAYLEMDSNYGGVGEMLLMGANSDKSATIQYLLCLNNLTCTTATNFTAASLNTPNQVQTPRIKSGVAGNSDIAGQLTLASGTASYTFASGTYTSAPVCTASDTTAIAAVRVQTTTTTLTITGTGSDGVNYICVGRN